MRLLEKLAFRSPHYRTGAVFQPSACCQSRRLTGIDRATLRPDLYGEPDVGTVDETDAARARQYALLSALLRRAPNSGLLARLAALRGDASPLGVSHVALAEAAAATSVERVEREFFDLFIGIGRGELCRTGRTISPDS